MRQLVFLDTEFTSLSEPYLVSIVLGHALYLEMEGVSREICSPFVVEHVLPLLDGPKLLPIDIAQRIGDFFLGHDEVALFCDAPRYDIELIKPFLPPKLQWKVAVPSLVSEAEVEVFQLLQEAAYATGLRRHHALDDARAMRHAWQSLKPTDFAVLMRELHARNSNASDRLSGIEHDAEFLSVQRKIIAGEMTAQEAIDFLKSALAEHLKKNE